MRIALTGNPNSGKTTMYNALTGQNEKVGNWAGVTVERKEHPIRKNYSGNADLMAVDLPGAYSMSPFPPCFAAIGAMNAELQDKKWLLGGICLQLGIGYTLGFLVYTVGTIVAGEPLRLAAALAGAAFVAVFAGILVSLCVRAGTTQRNPSPTPSNVIKLREKGEKKWYPSGIYFKYHPRRGYHHFSLFIIHYSFFTFH